MPTVTGTVENTSNKWDKVSIQVNGNWYSTKEEFYKEQGGPTLSRGDVVEFESGSTGKYLQKVKLVSAGAPSSQSSNSSSAPAKRPYVDNTIGMAVGAAMNQAMQLEESKSHSLNMDDLERIEANAQQLFLVAEGLKANATAGDITVGKEEREAAAQRAEEGKKALEELERPFD